MTDIHGEFHGMMKLLRHIQFNPMNDHLVFGGDMIDRGDESGWVVKQIKEWCDQYPDNVKAVVGNHEEMALWYCQSRSGMWLKHGGYGAIESFNQVFHSQKEIDKHLQWFESLPLYVEDESFVYTHAGLSPYERLDQQNREVLWMEEGEFYSYNKQDLLAVTKGKPIIHGHTSCEYIIFDGVRMNCDLGSHSYPIIEERGLGLVDLTNMEYYVYKSHYKKVEKRKIVSLGK